MKTIKLILVSIVMMIASATTYAVTPDVDSASITQTVQAVKALDNDAGVVQLLDKYFGQISGLIASAEQPVKELYAGLQKQVVVQARWDMLLWGILVLLSTIASLLFVLAAEKTEDDELYVGTLIFGIIALLLLIFAVLSIRDYYIISANPQWFALKEMMTII